ncbi:hypothetical protein K432DRAFT_349157 [Lepidopterella palustris CBS 459.81]|uniref:DASH complex subunit ASK1 n=1 Tax=Lepidopterella palustris CBS 459.81 TaxID=1314670 RepID=A0A8E2JHC4_9PEZI|nr:hypothetical protein K432DRAFT_349157 [Lepidopterella palustris CBS 459.81]
MSRQSIAQPRNLTLTEELEKLEQSITLTLQEIDHNFSRAHRIVTTSILPTVEQYAKHSEAVWEGSKFWKQFFEASANVSLSGYEEAAADGSAMQDETETSHGYDSPTAEDTLTGATATPPKPSSSHADEDLDSTSVLSSPSLAHAHSTPRAPHASTKGHSGDATAGATFADYPSPYESLKRELQGSTKSPGPDPITPGKLQALPDMSMTPSSSPFVPPTTQRRGGALPANTDPLLHRVLDKTYRIAATPHTTRKQKPSVGFTPGTSTRPAAPRWADDSSPPSSPPPQLRADIFSSPLKAPRTPGVSVQRIPARNATTGFRTSGIGALGIRGEGVWGSDSEGEEEGMDFSPPKTMQFHVPQSRLLQTPAREASKRIVEDLLLTAGGDITNGFEGEEEESPSVVRRNHELDDSF